MTKRTYDEFLADFSELKSSMMIGKKMFKEAHDEEITELKKLEKLFKKRLGSKEPMDEDYFITGMLLMNKEFQRLANEKHMIYDSMMKNVEKTLECVLTVNGVIDILGDLVKVSKDKPTKAKFKNLESKVKETHGFYKTVLKNAEEKMKQKEQQKTDTTKYIHYN